MRLTLNTFLLLATGFSAHAGQLAVMPPNAFVAVPPALTTSVSPTPAAPTLVPPSGEPQGIMQPVDQIGRLSEEPATGGDRGESAGLVALAQQIMSFDVQQLSMTQAEQAIPLLESVIAAPPVGLSASDLSVLRRQLVALRSIANQ